jgi:hypothetical protein
MTTETIPAPADLHGQFTVDVDGKRYDASFHKGRPCALSVTYRTQPGFRRNSGQRQTRRVWSTTYTNPDAPTGRAAEIFAMVCDPAKAAKAGAHVETPEERSARWRRADDKRAADDRRMAAAAKVSAAAPALLAALERLADAQLPFKLQPGESRMEASIRWGDERNAAHAHALTVIAAAKGDA